MEKISLKILPAMYGDCFLLSVDEGGKYFNILIDGGLCKTYEEFLRAELKIIAAKKQQIDLLINTHIDTDHINGLIAFLRENNVKKFIDIQEIWFNGLEQIATRYPIPKKQIPKEGDISIISEINGKGYEDEFNKTEEIGPTEGLSFSSLIDYGRYNHNTISNGKAITDELSRINITENIKIIIINPTRETLNELEREWLEELAAMGFQFSISNSTKIASSFEFLVSRIKRYYERVRMEISATESLENYMSNLDNVDTSIVNKSSISFILEAYEKKFLFLGDSIIRMRKECTIIKKILGEYGKNTVFDVIKLPHHGSNYNISNDFISTIKAKEYIISSNSVRFGHPDMDVIANIILKNKTLNKVITSNYPTDQVRIIDNEEWKKTYGYKLIVGTGSSILERRY